MDVDKILIDFEQSESDISLNLAQTIQQLSKLSSAVPHPAQGATLKRWQILARVAATDLTLAKWFESHLDALSILQELNASAAEDGLWAVWAAEGSAIPLQLQQGRCSGQKNWCSAAALVDYALLTYRDTQQQAQLLMVDMHQPSISINHDAWQAVGMQSTATASVYFDETSVQVVGTPNAYLERAGFWHGAAGVAACWYGAATRLAHFLYQACQAKPDTYRLMYLGEVSTALKTTQQYFHHVAAQIDRDPLQSHELIVRILRAQVEQTAQLVLQQVGKALGARPFCEHKIFAALAADLPVFLRQSHAAVDLEQIGKITTLQGDDVCRL